MTAMVVAATMSGFLGDLWRWAVTIVVLVALVLFWHFVMERFGSF